MKAHAILLSVTIFSGFMLVGCSTQPSPQETAKKFVSDLKDANWNEVASYTQNSSAASFKAPPEATNLLQKDTFKVGSSSVNGNSATVDVEVTAPDMSVIVKNMLGTALANAFTGNSESNSQAAIIKEFDKALNSNFVPMIKSDVKLNMVKTSSGWKVSANNKAFASAVTGHLDKLASELANMNSVASTNNSEPSSPKSNSNTNTTIIPNSKNTDATSNTSKNYWTVYKNAKWSGEYKGLKMSIKNVSVTDNAPTSTTSKDKDLVGLAFSMTNTTQNTMTAYPDQARLVTSTGEQINMPDLLNTDQLGGEIEGGVTKNGQIVWDLKRGHATQIKWIRVEWDVHTGNGMDLSQPLKRMSVTLKMTKN